MNEYSSATGAAAVTPSNTVGYGRTARAFYVGVAGNVVVLTEEGTEVTFVGVPPGSIIPIRHTRINSTSTTATSIVAMF
jgi:hypothetical protein